MNLRLCCRCRLLAVIFHADILYKPFKFSKSIEEFLTRLCNFFSVLCNCFLPPTIGCCLQQSKQSCWCCQENIFSQVRKDVILRFFSSAAINADSTLTNITTKFGVFSSWSQYALLASALTCFSTIF